MTHFVWSDTHFHHRRMHAEFKLKEDERLPLRPFLSLDGMDETMIENHNKVVGDNDIVYHLGDFSFGGKQNIAKFARRLRGRKRLILGNHDYDAKDYIDHFEKVMSWKEVEVCDTQFVLTHAPLWHSGFNERFGKKKVYNVHGHLHDVLTGQAFHISVCVENIGFKPVAFEDLIHGQPKIDRGLWYTET